MFTWLTPASGLALKRGEVHLWRADLSRSVESLPALERMLTGEERSQADKFRSGFDRTRFVIARAALRSILASYLKTTPRQLALRRNPQGKPELARGTLRFNVSHSDDLALYAITTGCSVGVDVELIRPGVEEDVAGWFCSLRTIRFLEALPEPARQQVFFQGWTRMEAYAKARGEGITASLGNFEAFLDRSSPVFLRSRDDAWGALWWLHDFMPRPGYIAALAVPGRERAVRYWKWQADSAGRMVQFDPGEVRPEARAPLRDRWALRGLSHAA